MNKSVWKVILSEYNRELLSYEEVVELLPRKLIKAGRLGCSGASEAELARAEKRLATRLPPSYRAFLKVSNGWRFPSISIFDLLPAARIAWFRDRHQDWIDAYNDPSAELPPISDREYLVYGDRQDSCTFRAEYLQTALQVSEPCDSAVVLLNPKVVTRDGEWEAWFFANWLPGAVRYRSFAEWLQAERRACRQQLTPLPKSRVQEYVTARKPVSVNKAQSAARRGQTAAALAALESFAAQGDDRAAPSLAELYAFLGQWDQVIANAGRLLACPGAARTANVFQDMVRLLGRAGHRSGEWNRVIEVVQAASQANARRQAGLLRGEKEKLNRDILRNEGRWRERIFRNLIRYARRRGKPPHGLLAIFGGRDPQEDLTQAERRAWYQDAVRNADSLRPDLKKNPRARAEYCFSLAKGLLDDEAIRLYEAHGATFSLAWEAAEYAARLYVRRGKPRAAWTALESSLGKWWPVDPAQVTPLGLLTDESLNTLMTPERCRRILSTPRGPEGAKAGRRG